MESIHDKIKQFFLINPNPSDNMIHISEIPDYYTRLKHMEEKYKINK